MGQTKEQHINLQEQESEETGLTFELKNLIHADKSGIEDLSKAIVQQVADGDLDPTYAFIHAKKINELSTLLVNNIKPYMVDKNMPSKGEKLVMYNVEFTQAEVGVKYDYSGTGDRVYEEIMERFNKVKAEKDEREKFLKTIKKPTGTYDTETGEGWEIQPPVKSGTVSVKTELK